MGSLAPPASHSRSANGRGEEEGYEARRPEESVLYGVVQTELETFLARAQARRRPVPRFVEREFRAYLECGVLALGFLRLRSLGGLRLHPRDFSPRHQPRAYDGATLGREAMRRLFVLATLLFAGSAHTFTITQITDNDSDDYSFAISGSNVVWAGCDGGTGRNCEGGDLEIYLWDGSFPIVPTQITSNDASDAVAAISGSNVAWRQYDGNDYQIYFWDGSFPIAPIQITASSNYLTNLAISGSNLVWQACDGGTLWSCDGGGEDWDVYLWDGSFPVAPIDITGGDLVNEEQPDISGSNVVWQAQITHELYPPNIVLWDGSGFTEISVGGILTTDQYPAISGSTVVWESYGYEDGIEDTEIYLWDGSTITQITDNGTDDRRPDISGSNVVWAGCDGGTYPDCSGGDSEIYLWNGSTITQITHNSIYDSIPHISGSNVVWFAYDGNDYEIYTTTIPEPSTALLLAAGLAGLAAVGRRQRS